MKLFIITSLFLFLGCKAPLQTNQHFLNATSGVVRAEVRLTEVKRLSEKVKPEWLKLAITRHVDATQLDMTGINQDLTKLNEDNSSLIGEVTKKTAQLIEFYNHYHWAILIEKIWFWLRWVTVGTIIILIIVADRLPKGCLYDTIKAVFTFIFVTTPKAIVRLFVKQREGEIGTTGQ